MSLPNPSMDFTAFDSLTAAEMDDLVENIEALADGSGLNTNAVGASKLATDAITLAYAQRTSNFTTTALVITDVTSLSITFTVPAGGRRVEIEAFAESMNMSGGSPGYRSIYLFEGATQLASAEASASANFHTPAFVKYSAVLSAGSHTVKVAVFQNSAGTFTLNASATSPAYVIAKLI